MSGAESVPGRIVQVDTETGAIVAPVLSEHTVLLEVISRAAKDPAIDLDRMERLLVMHERLNARRAEQEFVQAMTAFKASAPRIVKDKLVTFTSERTQRQTSYKHATLGNVIDSCVRGLGEVGISHRWDIKRDGARVFVTCILTHRAGHSQQVSMDGPLDDSGQKNNIQQASSTVTYLQRYTFLAVTGMATEDDDDDGRNSEDTGDKPLTLDEKQVMDLNALLSEVKADKAAFLKWAKVDKIEDILASNYPAALRAIEAKRRT